MASKNTLASRMQSAWNAFVSNKDPTKMRNNYADGPSSYIRPDRPRAHRAIDRSIVNAIYNRIALDVASIDIRHVKCDENDRYREDADSGLNNIFSLEANIDQNCRDFVQDLTLTMEESGHGVMVPTRTDRDPDLGEPGAFDVEEMRVGKVVEWKPRKVKVEAYNDLEKGGGKREEIWMSKKNVGICPNPFYTVMNEPNSNMQRLIRKLALLDIVDEQSSSGKLDLIIQLPYTIRSEARRDQAEKRRKSIEDQLSGSKYGIAYADATEHITQLNRPVENNLFKQVEYYTEMVFAELGMTKEILDGTASPEVMANYYTRVIEPFLEVIVLECKRKFLTKTARTQHQSVMYFRDPFKLITPDKLADLGYKFKTAGVVTTNEIRGSIGMKPSADEEADKLTNSTSGQQKEGTPSGQETPEDGEAIKNLLAPEGET